MKRVIFVIVMMVIVTLLQAQTLVFHENFEPPTPGDSVTASGATSNFSINSRLFHSGTQCDSAMVSVSGTGYLTTNSFSTVGFSYVLFNFSHICKVELQDAGEVQVSVNNGPWVTLTGTEYINPGNSQFVSNANKFNANTYPLLWMPTQISAKPDQTWWKNESFNISALAANQSNVKVRFSLHDGNFNGANFNRGWYIDDIKVIAAVSELTPPVITLAPPVVQDTIYNTGPFDIYAWITDASGIDTAYLAYQVNSGATQYIPMIWISDSTYKGTIPSYTYNTQITYEVNAIDQSASHNSNSTASTWFIIIKPPSIVQIGTGSFNGVWPFYDYYGYARSASIYLGSEINMQGVISLLQWDVSSTSATNCPIKIYLKPTTSSDFSSSSTWADLITGATLVYDGTTDFSTIGWKSFTPTSSYNYSSGNLMVLCETNYGGTGTSSYPNFHYTPTTGNTHQHFNQDNSPPTFTGTYDQYRPNIKIGFPAINYHNDAGVKQILTPTGTIIAGTNSPVTLYVKNFGVDTLKKATIAWKVDGVLQTPYPWVGPLLDGISSGVVNIGDVNVGIGSHTIKAWTELPNDSIDQNHSNDTSTISFYACSSLLSGNYTIGGVGADFPTFADAQTALNNCGVGGSVVFLINDGTYNLNLTFNEIFGVSSTNTITFKPNAGANVTITSSDNSTLTFNGSHYIIFDGSNNSTNSRNITIANANTSGSAVIWMASLGASQGCHNIIVKNCNIVGASNAFGYYGILIGSNVFGGNGGDDNDKITIQNNSISKAYIGIWAQGSAATNPGVIDSLLIKGNTIGSTTVSDYIGHDGIILGNGIGCNVEKNTIFNIFTTDNTPVGLTLTSGIVSSRVVKNNINNIKYTGSFGYGGRGLYVNTGSAASDLTIANNIIYQIGGDGFGSFSYSSPVGMYFDGSMGGLNIYYNSVYMSGNLTNNSSTQTTAVLFTSSVNDINLKNNVFQNSMNNINSTTAINYAIYSEGAGSSFTSINNNDYFVSGAQGMLGYLGSDMATISDWRTATGQDLNSLSGDPSFLSVNNLHSFSSSLNAHGTPILSVTDDIVGTIRNSTTPDIGAYEFDIAAKNLGILAIIQPVSSCSLTANEHITIVLKNFGSAQVDTAQVYYRINNGVVIHEQMIHTILPDSTYNYTFSALADFSIPATYIVKSYIHVAGDTNYVNDTINNYNINAGINLNSVIYTMGFEPTDDMSLWTKLDANSDGATWMFPYIGNPHTGNNSAQLSTNFNSGDDWLFSRCFKMNSGSTYKIDFWYEASSSFSPQNIDLKVGTDNTPTAMSTTLLTLSSFTNIDYQKATITFTPTTTGTYYFGWWGHSTSTYSNAYIDDINISLVPLQEATLSSIKTPNSGCGLSTAEPITIEIKNTGSNIINGNSITAYYKLNNAPVVSQQVTNIINVNDSLSFVFSQTADFLVTIHDSIFNVKSWISLAGDPFQFNDSLTKIVNSYHTPLSPVTVSTSVGYGAQATIHAVSADSINWYEFATGGTALSSSSTFITPYLYNTSVYYAEAFSIQPNQNVIDGTGNLVQYDIPTYGDNNYSWSGTIYDASELGFSGTIDTLFYYVSNTISSFTQTNQKIYMANTAMSVFPNANQPVSSGMTQVYSGTISWSGPGWQKIALQSPFAYNNSKNLMIYYENSSGTSSYPYPNFAATTTSGDKSIYASDYLSLPTTGYTTTDRSNIKLNYSGNGCTSARVPDTVYVTGVPPCDVSVQVIHSPNSGILLSNAETVRVRVRNFGTSPAVNVPIHYSINGGAPVNEIILVSIPSNDTLMYSFNALVDLSAFGTYNLSVYTDLACDSTKVNDTVHKTITCSPLVYCASGATYPNDEEIFSVTVNGATNAYNCTTVAPGPGSILNEYSNFTTLPPLTTLSMGVPIPFTIVEDECDGPTYFSNGIAIWVDLNRNGDFNDPGEKLFVEDHTTISPRTVTGTFIIPPGSYVGLTTMRITCAENYFGIGLTPCLSYGYGETEDYSIRILPPIPHDAGVIGFAQPTPAQDEGASVPVKALVRNFGLDTIKNSSNMTVSYSYNGGVPQTITWTGGNIPPLAIDTADLPNFTVLVNSHSLCGWTTFAGDSNTFNDTTCINIIGKPQHDAGVTAILIPGANTVQGTNQTVMVRFKNFGAAPITSMHLGYKVNGVFQASQSWTGTLLPSAVDSITFTQTFVVPTATYSICAYTELLTDENHANDTLCSSSYGVFTSTLPYYDNFDGPVVNWSQTNNGAGSIWQLGTPSQGTTNSAFSPPNAWDINLDTPYTNSAIASLYTQNFNFSNAISARIKFKLNYNVENTYDGLRLDYTTDGNTWQTLGVMNDPLGTNWYNNASIYSSSLPAWTGTSNGWISCEHKLSMLDALPLVRFRFVFTTDPYGYYDGVSIDNFSITIPSQFDAGVDLIQQPTIQAPAGSQKIVKVRIHNYGLDTLHSVPVSFAVNSGNPTTETWSGSLAPDSSAIYQFTGLLTVPSGAFSLCSYTGLPIDGDHLNDTTCITITGVPTFHVPYSDNFEGPVYFFTPGYLWEWGTPTSTTINAAYSPTHAWKTNLDGTYPNNASEYLYTPLFNFSIVDSAYLDFYHWYDTESGSDGGNIQYSLNGGSTWITLGMQNDPEGLNWYNANPNGVPCWSGSSNGYVHSRYRLTAIPAIINSLGPVQFRFHFFSDASTNNFDGWAVDNFAIIAPPIPIDAGVTAILQPNTATQTGAPITVQVTLHNYGTNTLTSIPYGYSINGGSVTSQIWTGSLVPNASTNVFFANTYTSPGVPYDLCAFTTLAGDTYWFNDSTCAHFNVTPGAHDVGVSNILSPGLNTITGHADTVIVTIKNYGLNPESNIPLIYKRNGLQQGAGVYNGTIQPNDTAVFKFSTLSISSMGNYDLCSITQLTTDVYADNNGFCIYPTGTIGIGENEYSNFELLQNRPNPSSNSTSILFIVPAADKVRFEMVDLLGKTVMVKEIDAVSGNNQLDLDITRIPQGVYFYSVQYKDRKLTKRMVITK